MAIVQCPNNHYFDDKRNKSCPYCENLFSGKIAEDGLNEQLTSYVGASADADVQLTEGYGEAVSEYERTIGIFADESNNLLTVGWLVCIDGFEKGKSYVVHSGRNFAGSSGDMDIALSAEEGVSAEKHFSIVYDPKSISFYLVAGSGHTYLNGNAIHESYKIEDGDHIQVGSSKYVFIQYCKEGRVWE